MKGQPIFFKSSHVTISNIAPKIALDGRVKACKIVGCNSWILLGIQPFKVSVLYIAFFALVTKMLV